MKHNKIYKVKKEDTIKIVSLKFNAFVPQILTVNQKGLKLEEGDILYLP